MAILGKYGPTRGRFILMGWAIGANELPAPGQRHDV